MGLGFRHDRLMLGNAQYTLAVRPMYQIIQHYGGKTVPTEIMSTRWTALTCYWEIEAGNLYLTGIGEGNDITQFFDDNVPELLMPLITHHQDHRIFMVDFTGMIAVKPRAWDGFHTSISMVYDDVSKIPDIDYEGIFVIQSGKLINQIVNLTCLTYIEESKQRELMLQQEQEFLASLHTVPTQETFYAREKRAYMSWFRHRQMFDDEWIS